MSTTILPEHANAVSAFDHVQRTRLVFGNGTAARTGVLARELGLSHMLLKTDSGLVRAVMRMGQAGARGERGQRDRVR